MTYKENITEILNCYFVGFKEEIIDSACDRILSIEQQPKFIAKADGTIEPIKNCNGYPTEEYLELVHKAYLFAEICDYDVIITNNGIFEFYNSPSHRSFSFDVEPLNYNDTPSSTIIKAFEGRL